MKKRKIGSILLLVSLFVLTQVGSLYAGGARGVTKGKIKIGMILVKTGPVAALGLPEGWGIEDTFNYANEHGGINGRKIQFIWEDDNFKTPIAIAKFKKLIFRDKVLSIVTMGGTPQTIALFNLINKYRVVNIPNGLAKEMYDPFKPYIFTLGASYETQINIMFDYIMNDLKAKNPRIGVVYAETEFGKKGLYAARKRAKEYGLKLVSELVLNIGSVDASSQVLALKKAKVDYVITCNLVPPIITFLKTAEKFNYKPKIFGINWSTDDVVVRACKSAAKNYIGVNFAGGWLDDTSGMKKVRMLAKKYKRNPKKMLTSLYTIGVGVGTIYVEALKRAGKNLTPETFKAAMETLRSFSTGGIIPPVTYTPKSHAPSDKCKLYRADPQKGVLVPLTSWRQPRKVK